MTTKCGTTTTNYAKNEQNFTLTNPVLYNFEFKVDATFDGYIVYDTSTIESIPLYGGAAWGRNSGGTWGYNPSMWPGQFQRKKGGSGQYLQGGNPSCNLITDQPKCVFSAQNLETLNPDLKTNTCCSPYFDISKNTPPGKELIFNSYYGYCYSGYQWNWDWCTNKQIWIFATPDYITSTKIGTYGYADTLDDLVLDNKTMMAQSTNTRDITFYSQSRKQDDSWCGNNNCNLPIMNGKPPYVNLPQTGANKFPKVNATGDISTWAGSNGINLGGEPGGCPKNCPNPPGWVRWGQIPKPGKTPDDKGENDKVDDFRVVTPGDGLSSIAWMPKVSRTIRYYPITKAGGSNPNAIKSIISTTFNSFDTSDNSTIELGNWMNSTCGPFTTCQGSSTYTPLDLESRKYIAYCTILHALTISIYNDMYSLDPPSGLTILNTPTDYINAFLYMQQVSSSGNSLKNQLIGNTGAGISSPLVINVANKDVNLGTTIWNETTKVTNLTNIIKTPVIYNYKGKYYISVTESVDQFKNAPKFNQIIAQFNTATAANSATHGPGLIDLLTDHAQTVVNNIFATGKSNESLTFDGQSSSIQSIEANIVGTDAKTANVFFNYWDITNGTQGSQPISAYDFINPRGLLSGQGFIGIASKGSVNYHVLSVSYTLEIVKWSPMAVLYYSYKNWGQSVSLGITDPLCTIGPSFAPPVNCMSAFVNNIPARETLLKVCNGGLNGGGGYVYSPPFTKIQQPSKTPFDTSINTQTLNVTAMSSTDDISNYIITKNSSKCSCIQNRLTSMINKDPDPTAGMCFSSTCNNPEDILELGLTPEVCSQHCDEICDKISNGKIVNTTDFSETKFRQICGKSCKYTYVPGQFNNDVIYSGIVLVPLIVATTWFLSSNSNNTFRLIKTGTVTALLIALIYIFAQLLNGDFRCNLAKFKTGGINPYGAAPGSCLPTWPFSGDPPSWFLDIRIPKEFCKNWWEKRCECTASSQAPAGLNCACGGNCRCVDQQCVNDMDPDPIKTKRKRSNFNTIYLIAAIIFSLCSVLLFNKFSKLNSDTNKIIIGLIIFLPLLLWFVLFGGDTTYIHEQTDCSKGAKEGKNPPCAKT